MQLDWLPGFHGRMPHVCACVTVNLTGFIAIKAHGLFVAKLD